MTCDRCGHTKSTIIKTVDSDGFDRPKHPAPDSIWRTRRCLSCDHRWNTVEVKTEDYEPFDKLAFAESLLVEVREVIQA